MNNNIVITNNTTTTTNNNNNNNANNNINNNNNNHHRISNGTQACAACKYQRRKCAPDCVLAPYFPHDRQRQFLNAHKLFGVSNITKIIRNLNVPDKDIAMRTIMYQSDARAKDPVGGCYRIIRDLQYQIEYCKAELELVLQQLALCKAQAYQQQQSQILQINHQQIVPEVACNSSNNNNNNSNEGGTGNNNNQEENYQQYQESLMRCYYEGDDQGGVVQYVGIQQNDQENIENDQFSWTPHDDAVLGSSNSSNSHGECFMVKRDFGSDQCDGLPMKLMRLDSAEPHQYDESHHVDITSGAIQGEGLEFGCQATAELSDEIVLKDEKIALGNQDDGSFHHHHHPHHHIAEHDLRSAATLFTLTS